VGGGIFANASDTLETGNTLSPALNDIFFINKLPTQHIPGHHVPPARSSRPGILSYFSAGVAAVAVGLDPGV
jgi:hypothetical protein